MLNRSGIELFKSLLKWSRSARLLTEEIMFRIEGVASWAINSLSCIYFALNKFQPKEIKVHNRSKSNHTSISFYHFQNMHWELNRHLNSRSNKHRMYIFNVIEKFCDYSHHNRKKTYLTKSEFQNICYTKRWHVFYWVTFTSVI